MRWEEAAKGCIEGLFPAILAGTTTAFRGLRKRCCDDQHIKDSACHAYKPDKSAGGGLWRKRYLLHLEARGIAG